MSEELTVKQMKQALAWRDFQTQQDFSSLDEYAGFWRMDPDFVKSGEDVLTNYIMAFSDRATVRQPNPAFVEKYDDYIVIDAGYLATSQAWRTVGFRKRK